MFYKDGKLMVKIISLLIFTGFYFTAFGQKAAFYKNPETDLNKYSWFYLPEGPMDAHDLTNPFIDKLNLEINKYSTFVLYNELSLKNLTILDGNGGEGTLKIDMYEGADFKPANAPLGYKTKKIKGRILILDMVDPNTQQLVWRGWIDLKKIKAPNERQQYQKAICAILCNFKIEPVIAE